MKRAVMTDHDEHCFDDCPCRAAPAAPTVVEGIVHPARVIPPPGKTADIAQEATAAEKRAKAVRARMRGLQWAEVAKEAGYADGAAAYRAVAEARKANLDLMHDAVEDQRRMEIERLDALQAMAWEHAETGDLKAMELCLKFVLARAKILGLEVRPADVAIQALPGVRYEIVGIPPGVQV